MTSPWTNKEKDEILKNVKNILDGIKELRSDVSTAQQANDTHEVIAGLDNQLGLVLNCVIGITAKFNDKVLSKQDIQTLQQLMSDIKKITQTSLKDIKAGNKQIDDSYKQGMDKLSRTIETSVNSLEDLIIKAIPDNILEEMVDNE